VRRRGLIGCVAVVEACLGESFTRSAVAIIATTSQMSNAPLFTVFTPTYNRRHTIKRVYDSLRAQTLRDFEWVVVDDGSTDGTAELIAEWSKTADFPIRYIHQKNSGKHIAHNLAIREAHGRFFAPLDSDDAMLPDALEIFSRSWNTIPPAERSGFAGVWGLCCDQHGKLVGDRYPASPLDTDLRDVHYVRRIKGEKWGVVATEILRQFPFPEIQKTQFIPEGMIWLGVAKSHKTRFVNELVRIYYVNDDKTGPTLTGRARLDESAPGRLHYYVWLLNNDLEFFFHSPLPFLKATVMLPIVARLSGQSFSHVLALLNLFAAKALVCLALPFSTLLYMSHKMCGLLGRGKTQSS
jgi:glycosyltransferase involved in cell wall biosynthesis